MRIARFPLFHRWTLLLLLAALVSNAATTPSSKDAERARRSAAVADTLAAWRAVAGAHQSAGRRDSARVVYERCRALARREGIGAEEGWAFLGLAAIDEETGRHADCEARAVTARELFRSTGDWRGIVAAQYQLAATLASQKRFDDVRREYTRVIDEAKRRGDREIVAQATGNFGSFEHSRGDPSRAEVLYRRALGDFRELGDIDNTLWVSNAIAVLYVNQGRYHEADSALMQVLPDAEASRNFDRKARVLCQIGVVRREQFRIAEAREFGQRAVSYSDSLSPLTAIQVTWPLRGTYREMGRFDLALALLDEQLARFGDRLGPTQKRSLELARGSDLRALGRPREALSPLREAVVGWDAPLGALDGSRKLGELAELARCYRDLGELDSAQIWYSRITQRWEAWRATTADPGWREKYDDYARRFTGGYAAMLLDPRRPGGATKRAREAFDVLQHFRARTLIERIHDPAAGFDTTLRVTPAVELQQRVLRAGETFVDIHALAETSIVIILTRDTVRAYCLARTEVLIPRLERWRGLLSGPAASGAALMSSASAALGGELLGAARDLVGRSRRVVMATGTLARFPLDQLVLPGENAPLMVGREVTWVPSASLLAAARNAKGAEAARPLLAVAQSRPLDGVALPAARREAQWLSQQFAMTDVMADGGIPSAAAVAARAPGYQVLHLAAHTRSGGRRPWQDAIRVGASTRNDAWLTAAEIARLKLTTRLCVMAGCSTVGGDYTAGETLEGLATAWLAAGARTVLATHWAVNDEATSELMRGFYTRLARGSPAGAALREAQLEMRAMPRYAHPYYWAGVQIIGEPDTRVTLQLKRGAAVTGAR